MNTRNSVAVTTIAILFLAGPAIADPSRNQPVESSSFLQSDESAEFAAYEFDISSEDSEAETIPKKMAGITDDSNEWMPEYWTDIP